MPVDVEGDDEDDVVVVAESIDKKLGFSSGERQLKSLEEIVNATDAPVYLLDEWDANLDAANKAKADALVEALARARPGGRDFAPRSRGLRRSPRAKVRSVG